MNDTLRRRDAEETWRLYFFCQDMHLHSAKITGCIMKRNGLTVLWVEYHGFIAV